MRLDIHSVSGKHEYELWKWWRDWRTVRSQTSRNEKKEFTEQVLIVRVGSSLVCVWALKKMASLDIYKLEVAISQWFWLVCCTEWQGCHVGITYHSAESCWLWCQIGPQQSLGRKQRCWKKVAFFFFFFFENWLLLCPKDPASAYPRISWRERRKAWFELAVPVSPSKLCEKRT